MKITVVTVAYNAAQTIGQTIASFLEQRHESKELLVIDGASTDETVAIAKSFRVPSVRVISEKDDGIYDAMNKGLRLFTGDAVGFLNSDDTFHSPDSLDLIAQGLHHAEIVFGDLYMVSNHRTKRIVRVWRTGEFASSSFRLGWIPPHATFYIRRNVAQATGEFDLRYRIASDYDYMLRAIGCGKYRTKYVRKFLVEYQIGRTSSGSLRNIIRGNLECLDSRRRHLQAPPVDLALFIKPVRHLLQLKLFPSRSRPYRSSDSDSAASVPVSDP